MKKTIVLFGNRSQIDFVNDVVARARRIDFYFLLFDSVRDKGRNAEQNGAHVDGDDRADALLLTAPILAIAASTFEDIVAPKRQEERQKNRNGVSHLCTRFVSQS